MKITAVDPFYLRMPDITTAADGTQDTLLVRIQTDTGIEGWGECDASPLVSLAVYCCPMSHGNIINIRTSLVGETLDGPDDVLRLSEKTLRNGLDIQQIQHAYSGAEIALWDVIGRHLNKPVYRLLAERSGTSDIAHPKLPYASVLFGDTPEATHQIATRLRERGYRAAKFGWGPMGKFGEANDIALVRAAREGMGGDAQIMIDAGVVWGTITKRLISVLRHSRNFHQHGWRNRLPPMRSMPTVRSRVGLRRFALPQVKDRIPIEWQKISSYTAGFSSCRLTRDVSAGLCRPFRSANSRNGTVSSMSTIRSRAT